MKNKLYIKILSLGLLLISLVGCDGMDETYKDLQGDGPIVYLGKLDAEEIFVQAGKNRIKLSWPALYDPRVQHTKITWANGTKEKDVAITYGQPTEVLLDNMDEASYDFVFYNYNDNGLKSVTVSTIGEVYGDVYEGYLKNRNLANATYIESTGTLTLNFPVLGDSTIVGTEFKWIENGETKTLYTDNTADSKVVIENYKGSHLEYRCKFLPEPNAIDYFYAPYWNSVTVQSEWDRTGWEVIPAYAPFIENAGTATEQGRADQLIDGNISSYFSLRKPGFNEIPAGTDSYFILDMKEKRTVDYFIWQHRNTSLGLRPWEISLYGSNDGTNFTVIQENVVIPGAETGADLTATVLFNQAECRYLKVQYVRWHTTSSTTMQVAEVWVGAHVN